MCPPYELVDYNEIYDLLHDSPLLHEASAAGRAGGPGGEAFLLSRRGESPTCNLSNICPPACLPAQESIVIVEYPKKLASLVRERLGPLEKLRDRRYGRTYLAVYGPPLKDD